MFLLLIFSLLLIFLACFYYAKKLIKTNTDTQPIYEMGPSWHNNKAHTPTKGGKIFVIPLLLASLLTFLISKQTTFLILFIVILATFLLGLKDDNDKIKNQENQAGLSAKQKLIFQFLTSFILTFWFYKTTNLTSFSLILSIIILPFFCVGITNATNLTDGLDGLLASISSIVFIQLLLISNYQHNYYLSLIIIIFLIGLLTFLYFNKNPAQIFMGDTGSLVIGIFYVYCCLILHLGLIGIFYALLYIIEMFSVIIQVSYFRYTKKKDGVGKRLLLMAPLHHHFEKKGYSEKQIVLGFSLIQLIIILIPSIVYYLIK